MTVLSRGARVRRGGRRPGWLLLTALLVLAIAASSALVFTTRVELLKLAVILALWAAVVAAFVSVIYRRQSDVDQARARDLKLVYDLQLDREISARREYELTVESQLRRELASELRAQAADEVAALRAELAALRTSLEILFETELDHRPALETERAPAGGYDRWADDSDSRPADWVSRNRVTSVRAETTSDRAEETSIIDVPEEPVPRQPAADAAEAYGGAESYQRADTFQSAPEYQVSGVSSGSHWRPTEDGAVPEPPEGQSQRRARHQHEAPTQPEPRFDFRDVPPQPQPEAQRVDWYPPPADSAQPSAPGPDWQPVDAEGRWVPAGAPGSNWVSTNHADVADSDTTDIGDAVSQSAPDELTPGSRGGRHSIPAETEPDAPDSMPIAEPPAAEPEPAARHRSAEPESGEQGPQTGGQSVADLLARLQAEPIGGGRRRRRAAE